jgi:hypothetical protein
MAKRRKKSRSKKAGKAVKGQNLYLLAIVSIVAIVGVVVLVLNAGDSGEMAMYDEDGNLVGEAFLMKKMDRDYIQFLKDLEERGLGDSKNPAGEGSYTLGADDDDSPGVPCGSSKCGENEYCFNSKCYPIED